MKNVVVLGGGTGLSHLLSGLKLFPVNVTAIKSVADNGRSTGTLKRELNAIDFMCRLLKINGRILPITEDKVELAGVMEDGTKIVGEENITKSEKRIKKIKYDTFKTSYLIFSYLMDEV